MTTSRVANRTGRVSSLPAMLPLLSKFSKVAARLFPGFSKAALYFAAFIVLVNVNSFPFIWHCESPLSRSLSTRLSLTRFMRTDKIFRHIWNIRIKLFFYRLTLLGKPKEIKMKLESAWLDKLIPIGSGANLVRICVPNAYYPHHRAVGLWHCHQEVCWAR
jgi:hypothetical protein